MDDTVVKMEPYSDSEIDCSVHSSSSCENNESLLYLTLPPKGPPPISLAAASTSSLSSIELLSEEVGPSNTSSKETTSQSYRKEKQAVRSKVVGKEATNLSRGKNYIGSSIGSKSNEIIVCKTNNLTRRVWDKKQACLYCSKLISKLPVHLKTAHSDEEEVKRFLSCKKGSKERFLIIRALRNKGNYKYNKLVFSNKEGTILPCRRPKSSLSGDNYVPCHYCLGYYKKNHLGRHVRYCFLNPTHD